MRVRRIRARDHWPRAWARAYVEQCTPEVYRWLRAQGVRYFPVPHWVERVPSRKSLGGIRTDLRSRVLSGTGPPIPGLYAVGEAAGFGGGGSHGLRALEGGFLGCCVLSARAAARTIVQGG